MSAPPVVAHPPTSSSWRSLYPVHPCADVFPMMSDAELDELAQDIRKRGGLTQNIAVWRDPHGQTLLLDGRNRLAALERLGVQWQPDGSVILPKGHAIQIASLKHGVTDPAAYVIAANIHRRHLTKEQRAELIVKTVEAAKNDRANVARSFNPTNGKKGGSTKDPVLNQAVTEAEKHGISKRTVQNARATLQGRAKPARVTKRDAEAAEARARQVEQQARYDSARTAHQLSDMFTAMNVSARMKLLAGKEGKALHELALRVIGVGYRGVARELHPDKGGSAEAMARLNAIRDHLMQCV